MKKYIANTNFLYWSGEHGMELFNSWDLQADDQKKLGKALREVSLSLGPEGRQVNVLCKIDSGAETNILPKSLY